MSVFPDSSKLELEAHALELTELTREYLWLHDHRFVEFFTSKCENLFPTDWLTTLRQCTESSLRNIVTGEAPPGSCDTLKTFISKCATYRMNRHQNNNTSLKINSEVCTGDFSRDLSVKKKHEVELLARTVSNLTPNSGAVLDIGSGKGYLPLIVTHVYKKRVAAVEASQENVKAATNREAALTKKQKNKSEIATCYVPMFLSPTTCGSELCEILKKSGLPESNLKALTLTGLHSCGDLTPSILGMFTALPQYKSLCVVGCCYYKMSWPKPKQFPMSECCKKLEIETILTQVSAQLACESSQRWNEMDDDSWEKTKNVSFKRAVLEVIIKDLLQGSDVYKKIAIKSNRTVGKMTFEEYITWTLQRLRIRKDDLTCDHPLDGGGHVMKDGDKESEELQLRQLVSEKLPSSDQISEYESTYAPFKRDLLIWATLRECISPPLESLFLIDRLLYLHEFLPDAHSIKAVQIFSSEYSPRNVALIAQKDSPVTDDDNVKELRHDSYGEVKRLKEGI